MTTPPPKSTLFPYTTLFRSPDATIDIDKVDITCFSRTINLHYTVSNINGEHLLKKGTPIAFYIGEELIGTDETAFDVPIGGSISGNILLPTPNNYGNELPRGRASRYQESKSVSCPS